MPKSVKEAVTGGWSITSSTRLKFNAIGAALIENVSHLNEFDRFETSFSNNNNNNNKNYNAQKNDANKFHLDDEHLKKLNTIWSNLPFDVLKQEYEKKSFNIYLLTNGIATKTSASRKTSSKSTRKSSTASTLRPKSPSISSMSSSWSKAAGVTSKASRNQRVAVTPTNQVNETTTNGGETDNTTSNHRRGSINSVTSHFSSASGNHPQQQQQQQINLDYQITIHVCDEVKRLKQDFTCPRDLLVTEMRYFNSSLVNKISSSLGAAQQLPPTTPNGGSRRRASLDDIDISVHCDINIFDWLMRYVKRSHPSLVEKSISSPADKPLNETTNKVIYSPVDGSVSYVEPLLDSSNAVSILLSSDFLVMNELREKCLLFISNNLDAILQVPCVFSSIPERLLAKLAACVPVQRLNELADKKDKIRTRLFQRKIEFMFDPIKLKRIFDESTTSDPPSDVVEVASSSSLSSSLRSSFSGYILNEWKRSPTYAGAYLNYLYECENDASTLFKCKLCNRFMTRAQSTSLKCTHTILDRHGELVYMHSHDERFDLVGFLRSLRAHLKTWPAVYWYVWSLVKSFRCKKCLKWFRLVDANRCRLNEFTLCAVHDLKPTESTNSTTSSSSSSSSSCTCMFSEHLVDPDSAADAAVYARASFVVTQVGFPDEFETTNYKTRLTRYVQYVIECFEKVKDTVLSTSNAEKSPCDLIEAISVDQKSTTASSTLAIVVPASNKKSSSSSFLESITGRNLSLLNKNTLLLIKQSYLGSDALVNVASGLDLKSLHALAVQVDPINIANNTLSVFAWLKLDPKMKWEQNKPTRLNQDNQREDDLRRLREISSCLVRFKSSSNSNNNSNSDDRTSSQTTSRTAAAITTTSSLGMTSTSTSVKSLSSASGSSSTLAAFPGGMYCRIENEWKQRNN